MVQVAGVVALGARCIARPPRRVERPQGRSTSPGSAPRGRGFHARCHDQMKKPPLRVACSFGGGGGSWTRVRRRLTPSPTCLAHRWISSSGSTVCEARR